MSFPCLLKFFNVVTQKFKITNMAHIILDSTPLVLRTFLIFEIMKVKYHVIFYLSFSLTLGKVFYSEDARLFFKSGKLSSMNYFLPSIPSGFFFCFCLFGTSMR